MRNSCRKVATAALFCLAASYAGTARAQQYNSDSWISKPHGTVTTILTAGERTTMWMMTFSLVPRWEFTTAAYVYDDDGDRTTADGYSTSWYGKYMPWMNADKTGGLGIKAGIGMKPSYVLESQVYKEGSLTAWTNAPLTLPFLNNRLSLDVMPGASVTFNHPEKGDEKWAFTYSTRLAWYPTSLTWSIVGEIFGSAGQAEVKPDYRVGLRWEPNEYVNIAATYAAGLDGSEGSGFELGVMLFSPPFLCAGKCRPY